MLDSEINDVKIKEYLIKNNNFSEMVLENISQYMFEILQPKLFLDQKKKLKFMSLFFIKIIKQIEICFIIFVK